MEKRMYSQLRKVKLHCLVIVNLLFVGGYVPVLFGMYGAYDPEVEMEVHNVGQGNCITVKVKHPHKDEYEVIIVDAGANSFKKEAAIRTKL